MRAPLAALKGTDRDAHGDVHEKAAGIEGSSGNKSGGNRRVPDCPHRPVGRSVATLRGVPPAVPEGAQGAQGAGMARPIDAEIALETALPPSSCPMPPVRLAGRGLSLGGTVGAREYVAVERGSEFGSGAEVAGHGPSLRIELEERGDHREADGSVWFTPARAPA